MVPSAADLFRAGVEVYKRAIGPTRQKALEDARALFLKALSVLPTRNNISAAVHLNLGIVYLERAIGDVTENLETAITHLQDASEVFTEDGFTLEWLLIQSKLAQAYSHRVIGGQPENFEKVLSLSQSALRYFHTDVNWVRIILAKDNPLLYGELLLWRGRAFRLRILGDPSRNHQEANHLLLQALDVLQTQKSDKLWGLLNLELGYLSLDEIENDRENEARLVRSIENFNEAMTNFIRNSFDYECALAQLGLGQAYAMLWTRSPGSSPKPYRQQAIKNLQASIARFSGKNRWTDWCQAKMTLAQLSEREQAISLYEEILTSPKSPNFPEQIAQAHIQLALLLPDKLHAQIAHLEVAEEKFCQLKLYHQASKVNQFWGGICKENGRLIEAFAHYQRAVEQIDMFYPQTLGEGMRHSLIGSHQIVYRNTVEVAFKLHRLVETFEFVERSRSRHLLDQLAESTITMGRLEVYDDYFKLLNEIRILEQAITTNAERDSSTEDIKQVQSSLYLARALDVSRKNLSELRTLLQQERPQLFREIMNASIEEVRQSLTLT